MGVIHRHINWECLCFLVNNLLSPAFFSFGVLLWGLCKMIKVVVDHGILSGAANYNASVSFILVEISLLAFTQLFVAYWENGAESHINF